MVSVGGEVTLGHQRGDLFGCEPVAGLDGGAAGHHAQKIVEKLLAARQPFLCHEVIHDCPQDFLRRPPFQQGGIGANQHGAASKVFHGHAQLGKGRALLQDPRSLFRGQVHRFGNEQPLRHQGTGANALLQLLEEDALVQGVLVDDEHALRCFHDQIGIVQLDDLGRQSFIAGRFHRLQRSLI